MPANIRTQRAPRAILRRHNVISLLSLAHQVKPHRKGYSSKSQDRAAAPTHVSHLPEPSQSANAARAVPPPSQLPSAEGRRLGAIMECKWSTQSAEVMRRMPGCRGDYLVVPLGLLNTVVGHNRHSLTLVSARNSSQQRALILDEGVHQSDRQRYPAWHGVDIFARFRKLSFEP